MKWMKYIVFGAVILGEVFVAGAIIFLLFFSEISIFGVMLILAFGYWYYFKHDLRPGELYKKGMRKQFFKNWDAICESSDRESGVSGTEE